VAEGINRKGRFTGVLTLTHNATSLILPGNADITTANNDRYEARSLGGGNWIVTKYVYANGSVISATNANTTTPIKLQCRAATTANITLAGGAPNTLDGATLAANDRILVKNQSTASENGIYYVSTLGTGANGTWTRASDADGAGDLFGGMLVTVSEGTVNADSIWMLTTDAPITIGTTALTFARKDLRIASTAEAQAQTDNTKVMTPLRLAEAFQGANQSLGTLSRQMLPGGVLMQWGLSTFSTAGSAVTFPITFPGTVRGVLLGMAGASGGYIYAASVTNSGFTATLSAGNTGTHFWLAIGS
jgi:phage-related tail fiber protein